MRTALERLDKFKPLPQMYDTAIDSTFSVLDGLYYTRICYSGGGVGCTYLLLRAAPRQLSVTLHPLWLVQHI